MNSKLILQPFTESHLRLLDLIGNPVAIAAKILNGGSNAKPEDFAKLNSVNYGETIRELMYILSTPENQLPQLSGLSHREIRQAAFAAVPAISVNMFNEDSRLCGILVLTSVACGMGLSNSKSE